MHFEHLFSAWVVAVHWFSAHAVTPVLTRLHAGHELCSHADDITRLLLIGLAQVCVIALVFRPLEARFPLEHWPDRRATRIDRAYTLIKVLGILPLFTFAVMEPLGHWLGGDAFGGPDDAAGLVSLPQLFPALAHHPVLLFWAYYALFDLVQYGTHRLQHAIPWWWGLHSLHHSQRQLSCWSNDRDHYLDDLLEALILAAAGMVFGTSPTEYALLVLAGALLENFSHANVRLRFGPVLDKLVVEPHYHRLHHMLVDPDRPNLHNCNFSFAFPLWDIVFGTALYGQAARPTGVGDPMVDRDNTLGIVGQQREALRRFWGAIRCRAGWRPGDVAFDARHRPVPAQELDLHRLEAGAGLEAARRAPVRENAA